MDLISHKAHLIPLLMDKFLFVFGLHRDSYKGGEIFCLKDNAVKQERPMTIY